MATLQPCSEPQPACASTLIDATSPHRLRFASTKLFWTVRQTACFRFFRMTQSVLIMLSTPSFACRLTRDLTAQATIEPCCACIRVQTVLGPSDGPCVMIGQNRCQYGIRPHGFSRVSQLFGWYVVIYSTCTCQNQRDTHQLRWDSLTPFNKLHRFGTLASNEKPWKPIICHHHHHFALQPGVCSITSPKMAKRPKKKKTGPPSFCCLNLVHFRLGSCI